jgi:hypoxia up-regulated 1
MNADLSNFKFATKMVKVKVEKERKRVHYTTLKADKSSHGLTLPISDEAVKAAIERNVQLLEGERTRARNAEAKNMLESFIIETRSKVSSDEGVEQVSQEEERSTIATDFEAAEDWLYEEGRDLDAAAYQKKKKELEKMTAPIFLRLAELEARPRVVTQANEAINWTLTILQTWATDRPEVTEAERDNVAGMCANFSSWLEEVEAKQAELPLYEAPAYLSNQVTNKLEPIEKEVRRLIRKPKPKPPKVKKNATNATDANATAANATTDAPETPPSTPDAAAEEPAEAAEDPPKEEL